MANEYKYAVVRADPWRIIGFNGAPDQYTHTQYDVLRFYRTLGSAQRFAAKKQAEGVFATVVGVDALDSRQREVTTFQRHERDDKRWV